MHERSLRRQVAACARAEAAVRAADRAVGREWRRLLSLLRLAWHEAHLPAADLLSGLPMVLREVIAGGLRQMVRWGHETARRVCVAGAGRKRCEEVARGKAGQDVEGRDWQPDGRSDPRQVRSRPNPDRRLAEAVDEAAFDWLDLLTPLREPEPPDDFDWLSVLFPAPSASHVERVIFGSGWHERLRSGTGLGSPEAMAQRVATGLLLGRSHQEIARDLLPEVQRVQGTARRIARTESMRVAHATQMHAHEQLGDLVIGYTVHATLDRNTRPWHRERDGTHYYLDPGPGQKGMRQCPQPPDEAPDASERPPGTPQTAWNCRCWLTPLLRD